MLTAIKDILIEILLLVRAAIALDQHTEYFPIDLASQGRPIRDT